MFDVRKMKMGAIVLVLVGFARQAGAQEFMSDGPGEARARWTLERDHPGPELSVSVQGRCSFLLGSVSFFSGVSYGELFSTGLGVAVETDLLWPAGPRWHLGPLVSVAWDHYDGARFSYPGGDTLAPDHLDLVTILAGFRAVLDINDHFSLEIHMGLGAADNSAVSAVLVSKGISTPKMIYVASTQFTGGLGTRFLYDSGSIFFDAGIGLRFQLAPDKGDLASNPLDFMNFMASFSIEFGVGFRF